MKKLGLLIAAFLTINIISSCGGDGSGNKYIEAANCTLISPAINTYTLTIKNIIDTNCSFSACHDAATASDGIDLSTYAKVKDNFVNGKALCAINHDCEPMPQNASKLSQGQLDLLACWVKEGAKE